MLESDSFSEKKSSVISLPDKKKEHIQQMLNFIYPFGFQITEETDLDSLLNLSHEYHIEKIQNLCENYLLKQHPSIQLLITAQEFKLAVLEKHCIECLSKEKSLVFKTDPYYNEVSESNKLKLAEKQLENFQTFWQDQNSISRYISSQYSYSDAIEIDCNDLMRYATIDRSYFKRNVLATASVRSPSVPTNSIHRSNSFYSDIIPEFPDYKMNLPKSKHHTVTNKGYQYGINRNNPSLIQAFNGNSPAELLKRLSPASTPNKSLEIRRNSSPVSSSVHKRFNRPIQKQQSETSSHSSPPQSTIDNEPEAANPGSFLAELQKRRMLIRSQSNQC